MLAKKKLNCSDVKRIDIIDFLDTLGFTPSTMNMKEAWYKSPLRANENKPSFRINRNRQLWFDYGMGVGGDIIKLGCYIYNCSVKELLEKLSDRSFSFSQPNFLSDNTKNNVSIEITSIKPISHLALIKYVNSRGIDVEIAKKYCQEVWFTNKGKEYFAIGFDSNSGYELRNKFFKGCTGKGITFINNNLKTSTVTEGFFDFLSLLTIYPELENTHNHIVLNSLAILKKAEQSIKQHEHLLLYLDRDNGGISAIDRIAKMNVSFIDKSIVYDGFNDLNEYLIYLTKKNE